MLICIDAGHAKNTAGKRSFDGALLEYEFNRDVAKRLRSHLERHGIKTMFSCDLETEKDIALGTRCRTANNAKADLFISIHANAYGTTWNSANGWEIFYCKGSTNGKRLAECIREACEPDPTKKGILKYLGLKDRGIKTDSLYVTKHTKMPAVLVEHGFYSNYNEMQLLRTAEFREKCAIADAKGLLAYLGIAWKENTAETANNDDIEIIKNKIGLEQQTIEYLQAYKYGKELIHKIANAVK